MDFNKRLEWAIKRCDGMIGVENPKTNSKFYQIYPFATENISGYIDLFNLKDKSLLTTGSSGDQIINAILKGCKNITLLDINPYAKFYFYLKMTCILELTREELLEFLRFCDYPKVFKDNKNVFNIETYNKIKDTLRLIDYESYLFWDELFQTFKPFDIRERLFSNDEGRDSEVIGCNPYLQSNYFYEETRNRIKKVVPNFMTEDIFKAKINKKYDNIWLSNIGAYLSHGQIKHMTVKFSRLLNKDGMMLISYLFQTTQNTKYLDYWAPIYNLEKTFNVLKEYYPYLEEFIGVRGLKFEEEDMKDSALIYRRR